jgi:carrier protein
LSCLPNIRFTMTHYRPIISPSTADTNNPIVKNQWTGFAFRAGLTTLAHPIEYAKVLIQIGHEPIAPRNTKTFFGKPALALPSVFQYLGHIKKKDGFFGLYKGLAPKLVSYLH